MQTITRNETHQTKQDYEAEYWTKNSTSSDYDYTRTLTGGTVTSLTGTATGKRSTSISTGYSYGSDYVGNFYLDPDTNKEACGFDLVTNGVLSHVNYNVTYVYSDPHNFYLNDSLPSYLNSVQLDYNGDGGVGVTFGEPLPIPAGTFDSGLDQFLPGAPPPPYTPMDMSGFPAGTPMAGIELGDLIRKGLDKLEENFSKMTYEEKMAVIRNTSSPYGWDIDKFYLGGHHNTEQDDNYFNNTPNGYRYLLGSITIDGEPYWTAEVNYILWGFAHRMYHEHMLAAGGGKTDTTVDISNVGAIPYTRYFKPGGGTGMCVITLDETLFTVQAWRLQYARRYFIDNPVPARRSSGMGIEGRLAFVKAGWDYYGEGPGMRGDFSGILPAKITDRLVIPNPSSKVTHLKDELRLCFILGNVMLWGKPAEAHAVIKADDQN